MKKAIVVLILVSLACFIVGLYIYGIIVDGANPKDKLLSTVGVVCTCIAGIIRTIGVSHQRTLKFYEEQYKEVIKDAFINQPKVRKRLLNILREFNEQKYERCIKRLNYLKNDCEKTQDFYVVNLFIGLSYTRIKQLDKAEEHYLYMINRGLGDSRVFSNLGNLQVDIGKFDEGIQNLNFALDRDRKNAYAYNNIAQAYFQMYEFDRAIEYAKIAIDIDPKLDAASSLLAIIYGLTDDKVNYEKYYHIAISSGATPSEIQRTIAYYRASMD